VKGPICRELETGLPERVEFIGSHPLAGSEKQGFEHSDPQLLSGRVCVVTPTEHTSSAGAARLKALWMRLGARVIAMAPAAHDRALAQTSHVPHVVAAGLAATLESENSGLAATGFRDTTRIAAGDAELWTAILLQNAPAVLASIEQFEAQFARFREAIAAADAHELRQLLQRAKASRDSLGDA
jgi:prephenate dehydrogenase